MVSTHGVQLRLLMNWTHEKHKEPSPSALLMAEWMIAFVWGRARCRGQAHDCVICARQLFGDNTVLPHYESHTVNLTKSYSLGLGPGEGGCKGP